MDWRAECRASREDPGLGFQARQLPPGAGRCGAWAVLRRSRPPQPGPVLSSLRGPPSLSARRPCWGFPGVRIWNLRGAKWLKADSPSFSPPGLSVSRAPRHQETRGGASGLPPTHSCMVSRSPATFSHPWLGEVSVPRHLCTRSFGLLLPCSLQEYLTKGRRKKGRLRAFTSSSADAFPSGEFIYNSHYNSLCLEALVALLTDWCLENIALSLTIPKCAVVVFTDLCLRKI